MGHSKLIVQSDQMFTSVKESDRKKRGGQKIIIERVEKNIRKAKQSVDNMAFQANSTSTQRYTPVLGVVS